MEPYEDPTGEVPTGLDADKKFGAQIEVFHQGEEIPNYYQTGSAITGLWFGSGSSIKTLKPGIGQAIRQYIHDLWEWHNDYVKYYWRQ